MIDRSKSTISHNIGRPLIKELLTRDLNVDLVKGLSFIEGKKQGNTVDLHIKKVISVKFSKNQYVESLSFVDIDHVTMFTAAADWFLKFQDENGGWKTNVSRVVIEGMQCGPGWYSAMGQGQAISLLIRMYVFTKNQTYLDAAFKATKVFHIPSNKNGVVAMLFDKYPWYEEYPVQPSLYVLNGFIYSLFGLYDLQANAPLSHKKEASLLYEQGINTLKEVLPLFDNGHGSFYDLRHISIPGHSPNRARWQYHRVHLEQMNALYQITGHNIFHSVFSRWKGYAKGELSRHN